MTSATVFTYGLTFTLVCTVLALIGYMIDTYFTKTINPSRDPKEGVAQRTEKLEALKKAGPELKTSETSNELVFIEVPLS